MKVEKSLRTLWTTRSPLRTLGFLDVCTLSHKVDGMLTLQSLNGWNSRLIHLSCLGRIGWDIKNSDFIAFPGVIQLHMNLESTMSAWGQVQVQGGAIAFLDTTKGLETLCVLRQTAESEVLESDDTGIGDTSQSYSKCRGCPASIRCCSCHLS